MHAPCEHGLCTDDLSIKCITYFFCIQTDEACAVCATTSQGLATFLHKLTFFLCSFLNPYLVAAATAECQPLPEEPSELCAFARVHSLQLPTNILQRANLLQDDQNDLEEQEVVDASLRDDLTALLKDNVHQLVWVCESLCNTFPGLRESDEQIVSTGSRGGGPAVRLDEDAAFVDCFTRLCLVSCVCTCIVVCALVLFA